HLHATKKIKASTQHDIKLELDVRCQHVIESVLTRAYPAISILGEEGVAGDSGSRYRWVIDPIDGTVNFTYGIPHACVSIALQAQAAPPSLRAPASQPRASRAGRLGGLSPADYETLLGVVYDPFCDELFTGSRGRAARLNGRPIRVSRRRRLEEAIVAIGFSKTRPTLAQMLPAFCRLTHRVRKIRIFGAAALSLAYVASGRMDAYVEMGLRLWDIAAAGLILECAGGDFRHWPVPGAPLTYQIMANNGLLAGPLEKLI
ncbi:MAG: inositol monophosphatase, partial [Verrucomicrobia bacterium]|nr:inositol monophosphatase [Verrucomicrobiota bacterium]